jgi:hypothetical protein
MSTRLSDLSACQRRALYVLAPIELALTSVAAVDLWRRDRGNFRGAKAMWWPLLLIQPFGPIAYLTLGRH